MRVECFAQSRPQEGRQQTQNQDAFAIGRHPVSWAGLCDGAGHAQSVGKRALALLETRLREASVGDVSRDETWVRWARGLDSALLGGPEATLVAAAVVGEGVIGVAAGDSRAYVVPIEGPTRLLTEAATKARLGSGGTAPAVFRCALAPRDVLILASDGAWTPLGTHGLERAVRSSFAGAFAEVPTAVLDAAGRRGRADDMTVVALRLMRV